MLKVISGVHFETKYKEVLEVILRDGQKRHVRGFNTIELSPFCLHISKPLNNIITSPLRKINKAFSIAEWLWMMSGRNDVKMLEFYNPKIKDYSSNGKVFNGAYGPRIKDQLKYVLDCFKKDINTRQAVIQIWNENPKQDKDIPCTLSFQFIHQDGKLNMITIMRSNDAWLGLPYDFYNFTMIQNYLSFLLNIEVGDYSHFVGSEHIYEQHYEKARELSDLPTFTSEIKFTESIKHDELTLLLSAEESLRNGQDVELIIGILHEPWKSMAIEIETFCKNKSNKIVQTMKT